MAPQNISAHYESIFHASSVEVVIPETSSFPPSPSDDDLPSWWDGIRGSSTRDTAYFDEKLVYFVAMTLRDESLLDMPGTPALDAKEPTSEMLRFLGRLQLSMTASFIPPLPALNRRSSSGLPPSALSATSAPPTSATLAPPTPSHLLPPTPRSAGSPGANSQGDPNLPPVTPNPFPAMNAGEEQYANVEGVVVWEGAVEDQLGPWEEKGKRASVGSGWGRRVLRTEGGWEVIWKGEVPIAYVRTPVQNPLLALTASVTLRDHANHTKTHRKGLSMDAVSIRSGTETIRTDGTDYDYESDEGEGIATMEEIDLLDGLAGDEERMPATRLPASLRQDLCLPSAAPASPMPLSALTPATAPSIITPSTSSTNGPHREHGHLPAYITPRSLSTTLRKSYRRVLALAPGLRVRMRTIFLPQLLPVSSGSTSDPELELEGERRVVLCVEIENNPEPSILQGFEVTRVNVEISGKGGKASAMLVCDPTGSASEVFPLRLGSIEQYNLLYAVDIAQGDRNADVMDDAVARSLGRGDESRPVSITVIGRPYRQKSADDPEEGHDYPTNEFHSRWNCTLDLTQFYASQPPTVRPPHPHPHSHLSLPVPPQSSSAGFRRSRPPTLVQPPNAIVGDKRYSLASLMSAEREREAQQVQQRGNRAMMPSQVMQGGGRVVSRAGGLPPIAQGPGRDDHGLLVSVKLLPQTAPAPAGDTDPLESEVGAGGEARTVRALEPFSLEVFVHNRTEQVRRFRLSIPGREEDAGRWEARVREMMEKRNKRGSGATWGLDDALLRQSLASYLAQSPGLIPLENDIRCGPLLPGASLAARIRFMALRDGVHRVDKLRVIGVGDEVDFTMSPVIDVVVGRGVDGI
ncbi:hypothetical protein IAT38_001507 [Cryptococcus sp. DSM 104549]